MNILGTVTAPGSADAGLIDWMIGSCNRKIAGNWAVGSNVFNLQINRGVLKC